MTEPRLGVPISLAMLCKAECPPGSALGSSREGLFKVPIRKTNLLWEVQRGVCESSGVTEWRVIGAQIRLFLIKHPQWLILYSLLSLMFCNYNRSCENDKVMLSQDLCASNSLTGKAKPVPQDTGNGPVSLYLALTWSGTWGTVLLSTGWCAGLSWARHQLLTPNSLMIWACISSQRGCW